MSDQQHEQLLITKDESMQQIIIDKKKAVMGGAFVGMFIFGTAVGLGLGMHAERHSYGNENMMSMRGSYRQMRLGSMKGQQQPMENHIPSNLASTTDPVTQ